MTALHFDTLDYANQLISAGVSREVANVQAQTLKQAFGFYIDDLVTQDYLDRRFAEQDARIEKRFSEQDIRIEQRFAEQDAKFEARFTGIENRLTRLETRINLLMALLVAGVIVPNLLRLSRQYLSG